MNAEDLLLFEVHFNSLTLTDGLAAYGSPDDPLIPIGELTRLLELDVDVQPAAGRIVGRLGAGQRSLLVDLGGGVARLGAQTVALAPADVAVTASEIYLRSSAVQRLLPLRMQVDAQALVILITASEAMPVEARLKRRAQVGGLGPGPAEQVLRVETPYRAFTMPAFDVNLGVGAQNIHPDLPAHYEVRAAADIAHANLQGYVGSLDDGRLSTVRATLEKRSALGMLLGPVHARVVAAGDVFSPALAIGPRSIEGRGIYLSTTPLDQASVFNHIDLRGELPLGDDVELYVNDVLISAQSAPDRGQYAFLNVPLSAGVNVVRIVTYGPHGERRNDTRIINVGSGLLQRGQTTLDFGVIDQDQPLVRVRPFTPAIGQLGLAKGIRAVANVNYGLTQFLTVSGGAAVYSPRTGDQQEMLTAGLRTSLAGFATQLDVAANGEHGYGATVAVAGRVLGGSAVLRHSEYRGGFFDENNIFADLTRNARRHTELTYDGALPVGGSGLPVSLRGYRDQYTDGGTRFIGSVRASAVLRDVLYSTGVDYERTTVRAGGASQLLSGYLAASIFHARGWQVRGALNYEFLPDARARDLSLILDRSLSEKLAIQLGVAQQLEDRQGQSAFASAIRRTSFGDLALTGQYGNDDHSWRLGVQLNFGLAWNDAVQRYQVTRPGPGVGGSLALHAFLDANGDGVFNPGEAPVPNVSVEAGLQPVLTGADGRAYLAGLGAAPHARVTVGIDRIENGMVRTPPGTVEFSPRPGAVTVVEYPIQPTGEVLVKVMLRRPGGPLTALSAVQLQLVSDRGQVTEAVTEFDGSVVFQDAPVGHYRLQLAPEQAARLHMVLSPNPGVVIRGDGQPTPDLTLEVSFQGR